MKERKISFTSEYDIETPGAMYYARKAVFSLTDHLEIKQGEQVLAVIHGFFSPIRSRHDFVLQNGATYHFQTEKFWKPTYTCEGPDGTYTLYQHKGRRCSIFLGERQVAAFDKNKVVFAGGNEYDVRVDSDANLMLILCMVLTINTEDYDDDKQDMISVDLGNFGPEARPFDESWEPR